MTEIKKPKSLSQAIQKLMREQIRSRKHKDIFNMGDTVRRIRVARGLSGVELCRQGGGIDPRTLTALEKGRIKNPSLGLLNSLARGFGISVSDIFRQAEIQASPLPAAGSLQGNYEIEFPKWGVRIVSLTPFIRDFFCGKLVISPRKRMNQTTLSHHHPIYVSVLVGRFEVVIESRPMNLKEGAHQFFYGTQQFSFYNPLERDSTMFFVTAPSFFAK